MCRGASCSIKSQIRLDAAFQYIYNSNISSGFLKIVLVQQIPARKHLMHFKETQETLCFFKNASANRPNKRKKMRRANPLSFSLLGWLGLWILLKRHLAALREHGRERSENMALWLAVWVLLWRKTRAAAQIILHHKWGTIRVQREVSGGMKNCHSEERNQKKRRRKKGCLFCL